MKRARDVLNRPFAPRYLKLILQGAVVGIITGCVVSLFRWIIDHTLQILFVWYPYLNEHKAYLLPYILFLLCLSLILGKLLKKDTLDLVGSGVPQIEAVLLGQHHLKWWPILWKKFIGGLLVICPGLFLGREGPCIQMGGCIGLGLAKTTFKSEPDEQNLLLSAGVVAGLAAAFSAPLAGVLFLLEEITTSFKPKVWLTALSAALMADLMTLFFLGSTPSLFLKIAPTTKMIDLSVLLVLGTCLGLLAYVYQYVLLDLDFLYSKIKFLPKRYHSVIPLLLTIPLGLFEPKILGGSHDFISYVIALSQNGQLWTKLLGLLGLFFVIRFVFSMVSYGASVPGGIFMPILVLGALLGCIFGLTLAHYGLIEPEQYLSIVLVSMAAYFGAIEKAPFTAIVLLTEMTGSLAQVFPLVFVTFVAYVVNELLGGRPIYTALREEMDFSTIK